MAVNYEDIINKYKATGIVIDEEKVKKAISFAIKYHGMQQRESGDLYYHHPLEVALILAEMKLDTDSVVTGILHDTIEDTDLTLEEIERNFGKEVAKLVDGVTKLAKIKFQEANARQAENFRKLLIAMSNDIRVLLVKLADRLHNMRTIDFVKNPEKRKRIAVETIEIYAPLSERIGIQQLKVELQDICFRILYPDIRQSIIRRFEAIEAGQDKLIPQIIRELEETLSDRNMEASVSGRRKTPYSTWMKMKQKNITIDQLFDIIAFRIIVKDVEDCYRALGIIHTKYKMIPNNFQDFISMPKNNGYQSLHTVVIGPSQKKIEIQIRTQEMHDIAELGVAAHWRYKQGHADVIDGNKYSWIRDLLALLEQNSNSEEFLQNTKMSMYYNQVFCFTPKGKLISLPRGATPIDFAYMLHTNIGNLCVGAKVNGRVVPLKTHLINGDQVEIITAKTVTVSPTWEKFVVTGKARGEIRKAIQNQHQEQYIKLGKTIISKAFSAEGINNHDKALEAACKFFNKTVDELFLAVGEGVITREEVIKNTKPQKSKLSSTLSLLKFARKKNVAEYKEDHAIPIKGLIPGMSINFAKCCCPLPGDKITGVVHAGSGISVHTFDCEMLNNFSSKPERILELTWDSKKSNIPCVCRIKVLLLNKLGSLATLAQDIARDEGNIINFKIISRNTDYFEIIFDVEVKAIEHCELIIDTLRTRDIIQYVEQINTG